MAQKHFLVSYLERAEQDSTKDFSLVMAAKHTFTEFFRDENNKALWKQRLELHKNLDLKLCPLFEAVWLFGQWKIKREYRYGIESAAKFEEMGKIAYEKNWVWALVYCIETASYIYKVLKHTEKLKLISKRIASYLREKKEIFPTHTILELAHLFNSIITSAEPNDINEIYKMLIDFLERKLRDDYFNFQRRFLFEAIAIARFMKLDKDIKKLQEKAIQSWIDEAEFKGKASNLIKVALLQKALDYSVSVGNKEKIQQLKKDLSEIDFSDELKEVTLPKEEREKFQRVVKDYYDKMRDVIRKYVDGLSKMHPLQIIWNVCNDEAIIRIKLKETRKFVRELMGKYPLQYIFGTVLHAGEKTIRLESLEEKEKFQLNQQLMFGVNETIWIVNQIFSELKDRNLLTVSSISDFLSRCSCVSKNNFELIGFGVCHYFQKDYVASVSILTPLIESVLFDYLRSIGADVSSYEGKVIEQRELGGLLNLSEVKDKFGEDFQYFLKLFLVESDSINFRNRLAHGNVEVEEFNELSSSIILFIILKICSKTFKAVRLSSSM